jgi:hypothetical protein
MGHGRVGAPWRPDGPWRPDERNGFKKALIVGLSVAKF